MAGRSERLRVRAGGTHQHVGIAGHVARNEHRLADIPVRDRHVRVSRRKGARRSLPVHAEAARAALHLMGLPLGVVVGDIVDEPQPELLPRAPEDARERLTNAVGHHLPVGEGVVGGRVHRGEVVFGFGGGERRARQLPVGKVDPVFSGRLQHHVQVVRADLMSEATGARVDEDGDHARLKAEDSGRRFVVHVGHHADLDKVVA